MDAASLTVSINGDASGLIGAVESAKASLAGLDSAANAVKGLDGLNAAVTITAVDNATPVVQTASAAVAAFSSVTGQATVTALDNTGPGVASAKANIASVQDKTVTITVNYVTTGAKPKARGTKSFEGGLALVNDERGISDPRELIVDRGMAFIPEGRDVLLPLSKGARVYTAKQTRAVMTALGIPAYASGKGNSDAFQAASDSIKHYTKTRAVTSAEELEKWVELSGRFVGNLEDAEDIEENIFSLTRKIAGEMNEQSAKYLDERAFFNDYAERGDNPIDAFNRVRERNYGDFENGIITWREYCDTVSEIGSDMYEARLEQSYGWLEQEREYNDLSAEDYIAGLERMKAYTEEYYQNGIISYREFCENIREIDNDIADEQSELRRGEYEEWLRSAENWYKQRSAYDDWDEYDDSPVKFYERCIERMDEMFKAGNISWEEYIDGTVDYSVEKYKAQTDEVDDMLAAQKTHIEQVKTQFENERDMLKAKWETEDRNEDMSEVKYQLSVYKNAVTDKGQAKYKELQEQLKKLRREEELYELEKASSAALEQLQEDYELMERNKKATLSAIEDAGIDVRGVVNSINSEVEGVQDVIKSIAASVIDAIYSSRAGAATYSDSRTINITAADGVLINSLISRGGAAMARGAYY